MGMPIGLQMAQAIARKILENPRRFRISAEHKDRLQTFTASVWRESWKRDNFHGWEGSFYWRWIKPDLPKILEKLAEDSEQ